jgi:hypothetical protein
MKMEADFFNAQPFKPPHRQISLLVVDFDDTCSASDTIALIAQTAIAAAVKQVGSALSRTAMLQVPPTPTDLGPTNHKAARLWGEPFWSLKKGPLAAEPVAAL